MRTFLQNVLRSTLLHPNKFTKKSIQFLNKMWKFLEGVKPPDKKIKITENQKEDRNKVYESDKRKRKYQKSWEKDREWLHYIVDRIFLDSAPDDLVRHPMVVVRIAMTWKTMLIFFLSLILILIKTIIEITKAFIKIRIKTIPLSNLCK